MKTIQEQIEVMQHYAKFNDGVEQLYITTSSAISEKWNLKSSFPFDWQNYDYRIKEQKEIISMEKWLCKDDNLETFTIIEATNIDTLLLHYYDNISKIKLLETYEVQL